MATSAAGVTLPWQPPVLRSSCYAERKMERRDPCTVVHTKWSASLCRNKAKTHTSSSGYHATFYQSIEITSTSSKILNVEVIWFKVMRRAVKSEKMKTSAHPFFLIIHFTNAFYFSKVCTPCCKCISRTIILINAHKIVPREDMSSEVQPKQANVPSTKVKLQY